LKRGDWSPLFIYHHKNKAPLNKQSADEAALAKANQILAGVAADPDFGDNSSLWEAMGRTRKSERGTGLTRKGKPDTGGTPKPAP